MWRVEGSDFLAEQAACHSVATYSYPVGILGMKLRGEKKRENKRKRVLLLRSFIHSTDMYHTPDPLLGFVVVAWLLQLCLTLS